jgi:hypothetical protein
MKQLCAQAVFQARNGFSHGGFGHPPNIEINLFWHTRYNKDPANRWLRQLMFELFSH